MVDDRTAWAATVIEVLGTAFPYGAGHASRTEDDCDVTPWVLHPAFHGSLDWHSSVHMQWSGIRLLEAGRAGERTTELEALLASRLTAENLRTEIAYLESRPGYERPYGWAWALQLAAAGQRWGRLDDAGQLARLADVVLGHFLDWLPTMAHPIRNGVHSNSAFALTLALQACGELASDRVALLAELITETARLWFAYDRDAPVRYEPSAHDFLSPSLTEADLMRQVLGEQEFGSWLTGFLPGLGEGDDPLLSVPQVGDGSDGQQAHGYGLALSKAAQLRAIAPHLAPERSRRVRAAADEAVRAVDAVITDGDFMATHWLVSFALLAEDAAA